MQLLPNTHTSPETAYTVEDYPYGFRLRCAKRYWLDCSTTRGARLMTQTTNPKKPGVVWNKPKAATFCRFGGALYLDDEGHVQWTGFHEYMDGAQAAAWMGTYGPAVPDTLQTLALAWVASKLAFDASRTGGADMQAAAAVGRQAFLAAMKRA